MTIPEFFLLLARYWKAILIALLLGTAVGVTYSALQTPVYTANASGFLERFDKIERATEESDETENTSGVVAPEDPESIESYLSLISSDAVVEKIAANPGIEVPADELRGTIRGELAPSSVLIIVKATAPSPEGAAALANGALAALAETVGDVEAQSADGSVAVVNAIPFEDAELPTTPSSPNWTLNILLAVAASFLLGLTFVVLRHLLDTKIRTAEDLSEAADGAGLLARIPKMAKVKGKGGPPNLDTLGAESFRHLRTSLRFSSVDREICSIVVTSPNQGEGKTTVSVSLARMLAESGVRTLLIDADLRRPAVAKSLGIDGSVGLSNVLSGQVEFKDVLRATSEENLFVLPSGPIPPNPAEMVGSKTMRTLVDALREDVFVIIDAPPVLPVTDTAVLSTIVDGVVFVAKAASTTKPEARNARALLANAHANVLGVVLNGVTKADGDGGYYYSKKNRGYYMDARQAGIAMPGIQARSGTEAMVADNANPDTAETVPEHLGSK